MGLYEAVALLITVFWFVGCSASMQRPSSGSNRPVTAKVLYVTNVTEQRVERFAMDAGMRALTVAGNRLGWCRAGAGSYEDCAWKVQVLKCEAQILWQYLRADVARKDEICRLDRPN